MKFFARPIVCILFFCSIANWGFAQELESFSRSEVNPIALNPSVSARKSGQLNADAGGRATVEVRSDGDGAYAADTARSSTVKADTASKRSPAILLKGNDQTVKLPDRKFINVNDGAVSMRFEQAPIVEVLHAVLGDLLKIDYAIVPPLTGEITLHTQNPVPLGQLLSIVESLLQSNGIVMIPDLNGRYKIGKMEVLKGAVPVPRTIDANIPGYTTVIVPLQNIGAAEMSDILRPVAPPEAFVRVDLLRNLLLLAGTRNQIDGWLELISIFDVDIMKSMSIGLFPLEYTSVKDIEATLRSLFATAGEGGSIAKSGGLPLGGGGAGGSAGKVDEPSAVAAVRLASPFGGLVRVLAIERLNALLVITPRAHYLEQIRAWIEKIDRPLDSDGEAQLYVYPVQNGSAQHLANLLNGLYAPQPNTLAGASTGIAPGLGVTSQSTSAFGALSSSASGSALGGVSTNSLGVSAARTSGQQPVQSVTHVSLGQDIRVVADNHNNALLIHAPKRDYKRIEAALRQLDVMPSQVLIEASIIEVTLKDELQFGLQWFFEGGLGHGGWKGTGVLSTAATGTLSSAAQGFTYTVTNPLGAVRGVLNALADKQLLNVISSPSLMVLDNQTASIQVGTQQPIRSSTTITDGGVTSSSIQYKDTGVLLTVTPSVNAGSLVTMQIAQAVSDVGAAIDTATGQRTFEQRQVSSKVAVRSGETIVLGGLIRDSKGSGKQGIPLLQDIPVFGSLFSTSDITKNRTELLVMITPRIVRNEQDVREVGAEFRVKMRDVREFLRR